MAEDWLDTPLKLKGKRIWVAGHTGLVGSAVVRRLAEEDCEVLIVGRAQLDLRNQKETLKWVHSNKPDMIILAAARVGGILANERNPAEFLYDNLMIEANVIHAAHLCEVEKLLFLGSSCLYPKEAPQPIDEAALLSGPLEPTNEAYAVAKIAGIKLCQSYRKQYGRDYSALMPCNLYGPGDLFDETTSHVIPALMLKCHLAKVTGENAIDVWGSGNPLREFLYVDDLADAIVFALKRYSSSEVLNIGAGADVSIKELAEQIAQVTGFEGELRFDPSRPDGVFRKLMNSGRILNAGWSPETALKDGLEKTYAWFLDRNDSINKATL